MRDPNCERCSLHETTTRVCAIPQPKACEVMIIGEAPGSNEEKTGTLFSGESGKLLMEVLNEHGLEREEIYITNAVNCRPPENRTPKPKEITACRYWVEKQTARVRPKYVLLLGNVPCQSVLDLKGIKKLRGKPIEKDGVIYLPTFHPAYILRDPTEHETFSADIRLFAEIIKAEGIPKEEGLNHIDVFTKKQLKKMMDDMWGQVSCDLETTGLYPWAKDAAINSFGFGSKGAQYTIPGEYKYNPQYDSYDTDLEPEDIENMLIELEKRVKDGKLKFITQNGKFDMLYILVRYGYKLEIFFDTMMAHFMIDENQRHGLKYLSQAYFGAVDYDTDLETKLGKKGFKPMSHYQAHDLYYTRKLKFRLQRQLEEEPSVLAVFNHIIMPCCNLFVEIEYHGVEVDVKKMADAEKYLRQRKKEAETKLNKYLPKKYLDADEPFNWGSPQQVAKLLFEDLGIKVVEKTKTGKPSTNESVLKRIDHPLVEAMLQLRETNQQLSFFIEGWKPFLVKGRLHPNFKLHGTVTGRLSCENPNLQQVPRDPRIRSLITAASGYVLIEADLSQIELRIAAELSNDSGLVYAFLHGIDPHWYTCINEMRRGAASPELILKTASSWSKKTIKNYGEACDILIKMGNSAAEEIDPSWKELRKKAKAINFGYLYGMWWKKFRQYALDNYGVKVTDQQAQASRESYFATYPDLGEWHKRQKQFARRHGYVSSLSGRKRRLPAAMSPKDTPERGNAERQAINSPVQSFANELNLMALLQLRKEFSFRVFRPVGTIHDAILAEVRIDHVEKVYNRMIEVMRHPDLLDEMGIKIRIPIDAEAKIGAWSQGVSLKKWKAMQNG